MEEQQKTVKAHKLVVNNRKIRYPSKYVYHTAVPCQA